MTKEQQRFAIAEACGWKNADHPDVMQFKQGWTMPERWCMDPKGVLRLNHDRPDYLNDLNAMHEAEKVLWDTGKAMEFTNQLVGIVCSARGFRWDKGTPDDRLMCLSHATAAQRAEAFLRTLNLWIE